MKDTSSSSAPKASPLRWVVLGLLFLGTLLNYLDRQTVSILRPEIAQELTLGHSAYSFLTAAFMAPYVVMYFFGGRLIDRWGCRKCMAAFVALWSLATMLGGIARTTWQFGASRFLLGLAEPGNVPGSLRAVTTWFPSKGRGFAVAVFSAGSALGAIIAPPLIAKIAGSFGWRVVFLVLGGVGFLWLAIWLMIYREPKEDAPVREASPTLTILFSNRALRGIFFARLVSDPVWYVLLFWLPSFLRDQQKLSLASLGAWGWIPFLAADFGGIAASVVADSLIRRGVSPVISRARILKWSAWLGPCCLILAIPIDTGLALLIFSLVGAMCLTWFFGSAALIGELMPKNQVASAMGLVGAAGALGGLVINAGIGPAIDTLGFGPSLALLAVLHPLSAWLLSRHLAPPPTSDFGALADVQTSGTNP